MPQPSESSISSLLFAGPKLTLATLVVLYEVVNVDVVALVDMEGDEVEVVGGAIDVVVIGDDDVVVIG